MAFVSDPVAGLISTEILRVSAKRDRLMRAARQYGVIDKMRLTLSLMDRAMHFAREARDERCPFAMIEWLRTLEDFKK